jgi:hypothetical protein
MFSAAELAHILDDSLNVFDWGTGDNAVTKIKDVAGAACGLLEDLADALAKQVFVGEERYGVEVALHGYRMPESGPALVQGNAPIEPDDVGAGFAPGGAITSSPSRTRSNISMPIAARLWNKLKWATTHLRLPQ